MRAISLRWLSVLLVTVMVHTLAVFAQTPQAPAPAPNDALRALLGADDNAALAIMYGGETRGNIDTCG